MTNARDVFASYAYDRKQQSLELFRSEILPNLVRYTPTVEGFDGIVTFSRLDPAAAVEQIKEQVDYFRSRKTDFEWKVYDFDEPENLRQLLVAQGFTPGDTEVLMIRSLDEMASGVLSSQQWEIVRVNDEQGVGDVVAVQEQVWNQSFPWLYTQLIKRVTDPFSDVSVYCAYVEGSPVGTGWTDFPIGSQYPELHGGAVLKEWRGRRIYTDLYRARVAEASHRKYRHIVVDAGPMSRPVLERLGFLPVCHTTPMRYKVT